MSNQLIKTQSDIAKSMITNLRARVTGLRPNSGNIILLDLSSSMNELTDSDNRRIDALRDALKELETNNYRLFGFNNNVFEITSTEELTPEGGTALNIALDAMYQHQPTSVIVITDGEPNNAHLALRSAEQLQTTINVIFVGSKYNTAAIDFCQQLATANQGKFVRNHLEAKTVKALSGEIRLMLTDGSSAIAL